MFMKLFNFFKKKNKNEVITTHYDGKSITIIQIDSNLLTSNQNLILTGKGVNGLHKITLTIETWN